VDSDASSMAETSADGSPGNDGGRLDAPGGDASNDSAQGAETSLDASRDGDSSSTSPCPSGTQVVLVPAACTGAAVPTPSAWASALSPATRGDVASLDTATLDSAPCLDLTVCQPLSAPSLLFSDSPETPSSDGVLYADTVGPGTYRLYVYQANGGSSARKFPLVVLAQGSDVHVSIVRRGLGGTPSTDYVGVGKAAVLDWLASTGAGTVTVPAGTRVLLDPALDALHAGSQQLVNAIYDVTLDAAAKISFVSVGATEDAATLTASLPLLPKDPNHDRGTFPGAERWFVAKAPLDASSLRTLRIGDVPLDPPLTGTDRTTGASASLGGNYGVLYRVQVQLAATAGVTLFARGGDWGGGGDVPPGTDGATTPVALPSATSALSAGSQAAVVGLFATGTALSFSLMSAGGSSLPVDVALAPLP
jgi:hypothetical protein